jgi:prophage antirepressor-like protein
MIEEIKTDNNCIVKAFENNPISILHEDIHNKKVYYFKASDVGNALGIVNIRTTIQNYEDDDERVVRKVYDPHGTLQDTIFLTSQGVYRLLYSSKKEIAKKFRKWAGNILDDIIFNESEELKRQLEEKNKKIEEQQKTIKILENKPETYGFDRNPGYIYVVEDTIKPGHIKLGHATEPNNRISSLNVSSSTYSLKILATFETFDKEFAEKIVHYSLNPFRIKNRKEWFYFQNKNEIIYALNTIKNCIDFIKIFDINEIEEIEDNNLELLLININKINVEKENVIKEIQKEKRKITNKKIIEKCGPRTGNFKGTTFIKDRDQWRAEIQHNNKRYFLGYYTDEIDAAKVYNDYAAYLNKTENTNFFLNEILGYKTIPRNVFELNKIQINDKKTSKYNGVSYDSKRKYFVAGIKLAGKTYNLGSNIDEIKCAKLYNQQAMYFNNTLNTHYILNDIPNYVTIPKNISEQTNNINKTSKYYGVSLTKTNKWVCSYVINKKKIHIGTFNTELEACKAYNNVVIELNKNGCNYNINII